MSSPQAGDTQGNMERRSRMTSNLPISTPAASPTHRTDCADAEAAAHTDWLAASFDALVDGIAIMDREGSILRMNRAGRALLGLDSDEAVASFFRLPPEQRVKYFDMRDEHGQPLTVERLPQQHILRGEILAGPSAMEVYIAARDGQEMIWSFEGAPIRDAEGHVTGGAVTFRDITAAKRLQIEHERLLEQEQAARAEAEAITAELQALQRISEVALRHLQLEDLLRELLTRTCEAMGADNTAILLLTEDGHRLAVHMAYGPEVESVGHVYVPVGEGIAGRIAATRQPVIVDDLSAAQPVNPLLRERLRSLVGVPLLTENRLIGVLHVDSVTPRQFTQRDINFLQLAADRIAQAIEQARLYRAEQVARREAEIANERLQAVLDVLPVGVVFTDNQGRFLKINDAMRAIWGQDAPYLSGVLDYGTYVGWWPDTERLIAPEEWALARALLSGEVVFDEEIRIQAFDGTRKTIRTGAAPMRDEHGATIGAVCITEDITERKRLERDLAEQANQLATIFETMSDAVVLYDRDGCILRANPATLELLGTPGSPEFLTMPLRERVQPLAIRDAAGQPLPTEELPVARVLRGEVIKGSMAVEMRARAFDGRERDFSVRGAPLREADGRIAGAVLVFQDVSERQGLIKRLGERAAQLELTNREMDDLIGIVTHELRTPLTSLKANVQIAMRRLSRIMEDYQHPPASAYSDRPAITISLDSLGTLLTKTEAQSLRLERMVSDLLDTSRAQRGALDLAPEVCDLAAVVREIVEEQRQAHPARTIRLTTPKGAVPVVADAQRIGQVLTNYLSNARKYAPADQPVEVTLRVARQHARVAVRDHGPGLAQKEQQHIWERFHRVPGTEVSDDVGPQANLGLGLYICKNIVEGHGGRIGVSSRPGDGATFWFSLPLAPTP